MQVKLISITTADLFTDEEYEQYAKILSIFREYEAEKHLAEKDKTRDPTIRQEIQERKNEEQDKLTAMIRKHVGCRLVSTRRLVDTRKVERDEEDEPIIPDGISWRTLKTSKKIQEFMSDGMRAIGAQQDDVVYDKIIVRWKSEDILEQITNDGFDMDILMDDGSVERKHYICTTASAGQLRTDKVQFMMEETWKRIEPRMLCGLTVDEINRKGGINANKYMAYVALGCSATIPWEMDIDRCIVIRDFEAPVEGVVDYIDENYRMARGIHEVIIDHSDGCGMMLPKVSRRNFQIRGPWIKGLLTSFDYLKFCKVNEVEPVLEDIYGTKHDLIAEDIQVIFTESQFKLWKYYDSWDDYKKRFKENGCTLNQANPEDEYIADSNMNYQMLQTLTLMTDEEIEKFTERMHRKINNLCTNGQAMLQALHAHRMAGDPYRRALALYPELLRDGYSRSTLKSMKQRMILDARSGRIKCDNKRLFAIPDMYAACQYWFLHQMRPEGLLKDGEIACRAYRDREKVDCLRSPHLYMEHAIRKVVKDQEIYDWFYTNGVYTSCHDLISKILQFDVDGDQLNVVADEVMINAAEREIKAFDIVPLLYKLGKAGSKPVNSHEIYAGLKRAHDYSGIGQVSNGLTRLWAKPKPDRYAAACLTYYNNLVIDGAKTGFVNTYENYPDVKKRISKATGGRNARMPYHFQFSMNGRCDLHLPKDQRKKYSKCNNSTMNRIAKSFEHVGIMNMYQANVQPFNWQMLLSGNDAPYIREAVEVFCDADDGNVQNLAHARATRQRANENENTVGYEFIKEDIVYELEKRFGSIEACYPTLVKYLFAGAQANKAAHKRMFWRIFGDMAVSILEENLKTYTVCEKCGMKIPSWATRHTCPKDAMGFFECMECGAWVKRMNGRQIRCESCQKEHKRITNRAIKKRSYKPRKEK